VDKVTMPGRKDAYRLYGADGHALVDLLQQPDEPPVVEGTRVLCRHPFQVCLLVLHFSCFDVWLRFFLFCCFFCGICNKKQKQCSKKQQHTQHLN